MYLCNSEEEANKLVTAIETYGYEAEIAFKGRKIYVNTEISKKEFNRIKKENELIN